MSIVKIDASNPANFKEKRLIEPGEYVFEIANIKADKAKETGNSVLKVEMRCQDNGEFRGAPVFDSITLTKNAEWKFAHLCLSAGFTKDEIANGIDTSDLIGRFIKAKVSIVPAGTYNGNPIKERNVIDAYVFDAQ